MPEAGQDHGVRVYFSTVIRAAPPSRGGNLVSLDWAAKRVDGSVPIAPTDPTFADDNPRGNSRGGRGIVRVGEDIVVASYHTLHRFGQDLAPRGRVSHGLLVGLHELDAAPDGLSVWAASTSIDCAVLIRLDTGEVTDERWPRLDPRLQAALGIGPAAIDRTADNRGLFMAADALDDPDRLHLNAVRLHRGHLLGLLHARSLVADLDTGEIVIAHDGLKRAHDLVITEDGIAIVNDTYGRTVRFFDLANGKLVRTIDLMAFPWVRELEGEPGVRSMVDRILGRAGLKRPVVARPLFVRGLARHRGRLYVGVSPASILEIDEPSGELLDVYRHSQDVNEAVHGLYVEDGR